MEGIVVFEKKVRKGDRFSSFAFRRPVADRREELLSKKPIVQIFGADNFRTAWSLLVVRCNQAR